MDASTYKMEKQIYKEQLYCVKDYQLQQLLHRSIGAIKFRTSKQKNAFGCGSGALLSPTLILTAAHNFYDNQQYFRENDEFSVFFLINGAIKSFQLAGWRYPVEYQTCKKKERIKWDYGLLKLKQPITYDSYLILSQPCCKCLKQNNKETQLNIFGFPNYKQSYTVDKRGNYTELKQFGLCRNGRIEGADPQTFNIKYAISTQGGMSGCPVVIDDKIIAIHSGSFKENQYNMGRLVTADFVANLLRWCRQMNCNPVSLQPWLCKHKELPKDKAQLKPAVVVSPETSLSLNGENLSTIDLRRYVNLVQLSLGSNKLITISLAGLTNLTTLTLYENKLTSIDLQENTRLTYINLSQNNLQLINLSSNTSLNYIQLQLNKLNLICLWISDRLTAHDHLKKYLFSNQRSPNCQIQILHKRANSQKCGQIISLWKSHYCQAGKRCINEHNCKYSYLPVIHD